MPRRVQTHRVLATFSSGDFLLDSDSSSSPFCGGGGADDAATTGDNAATPAMFAVVQVAIVMADRRSSLMMNVMTVMEQYLRFFDAAPALLSVN